MCACLPLVTVLGLVMGDRMEVKLDSCNMPKGHVEGRYLAYSSAHTNITTNS